MLPTGSEEVRELLKQISSVTEVDLNGMGAIDGKSCGLPGALGQGPLLTACSWHLQGEGLSMTMPGPLQRP